MYASVLNKKLMALTSMVFLTGCSALFPPTGSNGAAKPGSSNPLPMATGKVAVVMKAVNYNLASRQTQAIVASNTNNTAADSIVSTAPDQMVVYLQAISGISSGSEPVQFWTSAATEGVAVSLQNGNADLSALTDGQLTVPAGAYEGVRLQFARVGQIKGSVRGTFGYDVAAGTGPYASSPAAGAANQYTNEAVQRGQTMTFATRADMSQLSAETFSMAPIGQNADFNPALNNKLEAELADIDLAAGNDENLSVAQIRRSSVFVETNGGFSVPKDGSTTLTLAVDLNRMLRFYANTRSDHQPPNPGMKAGTSYFFTTLFPSSISVFGGPVGSVQGYQISANSVDAWLTLFLDAAGNVLSASVMPDDDNALTIMKGNGLAFTGQLDSGLGMDLGISPSAISGFKGVALNATGSATLTIKSSLWSQIPTGTQYNLSYQRLL